MRIGIVGAGNLGTALGGRLAGAGHEIVVGFARTAEKVAQAARLIGGGAEPGSPEDAARHGEVVVLATPWAATPDLVAALADALVDRVVWDTTNPFAPDMSALLIGTTTSAGEEVARLAAGARVVKAVAPFAELLRGPAAPIDGRLPGVFVCGDDAAARVTVAGLVSDVGCDPVDAGPLRLARFTEPLGMLLTNLAYAGGMGPRISAVLVRDTTDGG